MKTSFYKSLCLLLMILCCFPISAEESPTKHINCALRIGITGGTGLNITPADCAMQSHLGGGGALAFDYAFYGSLNKAELGLRTGFDMGYLYSPYRAEFMHQFSNIDYLGNQIDYTTSGVVDVSQYQVFASVPLMLALRAKGFVWNIGMRFQLNLSDGGEQRLSNAVIKAYYPAFGVELINEPITGVVSDDQLSMPISRLHIPLYALASTEIGYERTFKNNRAFGILAYCNVGVWNNLPQPTQDPVILVEPIINPLNPVPAVTVNDAQYTLLSHNMPLQFGLKIYYAFSW